MKIETDQPRLPINRLKRPVRQQRKDEPQDLLLADKDGEELDNVVKKLYRKKIEIMTDSVKKEQL